VREARIRERLGWGRKGETVRGGSHAVVERGTFYEGKDSGRKLSIIIVLYRSNRPRVENLFEHLSNGDDNYMTCITHPETL
jgi:hypothetical protein